MTLDPARVIAALALVLALTGGYFGFNTAVQDLAFTRAQTELSFWGRGNYQPSPQAIRDTEQTLAALLQARPLHPEYLTLQARYRAWQAYWSDDMNTRESLNRAAMDSHYRALLSRPAHRHSWSIMVEYASRTGSGEAMRQFAQERLELLQPSAIAELTAQDESR